ncbi:MAG: hypothetical protein KGL48_16225 [Sphingomonadales bacterium]|nr:hypothetical protein [Sphingomonadales bacterium]MDE2568067.1 hypothetical protein [Sphingomonadales bacterium]
MNTFDFQGHTLRTIDLDGTPWFVAADACRCLGLSLNAGTTHHLARLEADERKLAARKPFNGRDAHKTPLILAEGGAFEWRYGEVHTTIITESGLYKLIMRSDKAEALAFQNWVTREVLPSIRRTGGYLLNENARQTAHADTKEAVPLPAGMSRDFTGLRGCAD